MKKPKRLVWPKRTKFTLPKIVAYFKKIEQLNRDFGIQLIEQSIGYPDAIVEESRIVELSRYITDPFKSVDTGGKIECGMCVGAHIHFLSEDIVDLRRELNYVTGIANLARLIFDQKDSAYIINFEEYLSKLVSLCFKDLMTKSQIDAFNKKHTVGENDDYDFKDVCDSPFNAYEWPVLPSKVFQCVIDHPELVEKIKKSITY